jgi:hypothetical protein
MFSGFGWYKWNKKRRTLIIDGNQVEETVEETDGNTTETIT